MASWGQNIVITEPAPALAYPARYLAPVADDGDEFFGFVIGGIVGSAIVFLGFGAIFGALAAQSIGPAARIPTHLGFDLLVGALIATSYILVARYGLRYSKEEHRVLAVQGNTAWRYLPRVHQAVNIERIRAMNAAARLLLIRPNDREATAVLRTNSQILHQLTLTEHETHVSREDVINNEKMDKES